MLSKLEIFCFLTLVNSSLCVFTFRNVMVTCDSASTTDDQFATTVTTNQLKPHLPDQKCFKISIQYAQVQTLYKNSLSNINKANFLVLENDNIEEIEPGAFANVSLKEALSLRSNKIREIRRGVFNFVEVPVLFLSFNDITYIDYQAFDDMPILQSVHLDHNHLNRIDALWFRNSPKVSKVNLQQNLIQQVPDNAFRNLVKSSRLHIDLSQNLIRSVDKDAFSRLKKLHFLSLAHNKLQDLERNWLKNVEVDVLDISNNQFRCLNEGLAKQYSTNYIDHNPWDCNCLENLKKKQFVNFGRIVADEAFRRCNLY